MPILDTGAHVLKIAVGKHFYLSQVTVRRAQKNKKIKEEEGR